MNSEGRVFILKDVVFHEVEFPFKLGFTTTNITYPSSLGHKQSMELYLPVPIGSKNDGSIRYSQQQSTTNDTNHQDQSGSYTNLLAQDSLPQLEHHDLNRSHSPETLSPMSQSQHTSLSVPADIVVTSQVPDQVATSISNSQFDASSPNEVLTHIVEARLASFHSTSSQDIIPLVTNSYPMIPRGKTGNLKPNIYLVH